MTIKPRTTQLMLTAALFVSASGAVLAIAQPGDLGGDDSEQASSPLGSGGSGTTATTAAGAGTSATTGTTAAGGATSTTLASGLGADGASTADGSTAATGIESLLAPGLALGGLGAALHAARRRVSAP